MNAPDLQWITTATETELRHHLLTCDGRGVKAKTAMLDELLRRQRAELDSAQAGDGGRQV